MSNRIYTEYSVLSTKYFVGPFESARGCAAPVNIDRPILPHVPGFEAQLNMGTTDVTAYDSTPAKRRPDNSKTRNVSIFEQRPFYSSAADLSIDDSSSAFDGAVPALKPSTLKTAVLWPFWSPFKPNKVTSAL